MVTNGLGVGGLVTEVLAFHRYPFRKVCPQPLQIPMSNYPSAVPMGMPSQPSPAAFIDSGRSKVFVLQSSSVNIQPMSQAGASQPLVYFAQAPKTFTLVPGTLNSMKFDGSKPLGVPTIALQAAQANTPMPMGSPPEVRTMPSGIPADQGITMLAKGEAAGVYKLELTPPASPTHPEPDPSEIQNQDVYGLLKLPTVIIPEVDCGCDDC